MKKWYSLIDKIYRIENLQLSIIKIFKPSPIDETKITEFINEIDNIEKPDKKEWIVIFIILSMILLWILSSWVSFLDTTIIAICGLLVMFLPGVDLFSWKEFQNEVSWSTILMVGCMLSVGSLINDSGVANMLADTFFSLSNDASLASVLIKLALFMYIVQIILLNGPAAIATTSIPVITAAISVGVNPVILLIPVCLFSSWAMILPLNPVPKEFRYLLC